MPAMVHPRSNGSSPRFRRFKRLTSLGGLSLLLASCSFIEIDSPLTIFEPKGPNSDRINDLFWLVFWIAVVIFVIVQVLIVVAIVVFRDRPGRKEPKQTSGNPILEVTWTIIPTLILAGIAIPTVRGVLDLADCRGTTMDVEVIGHQWWFEYRYPETGVTTANVMVIPAGVGVCAKMTSADVVHNFWVPALHGKRYLIPGQESELMLESYEPGEFWGHCAEFCGLSHSLMRARVLAVTAEEFEAWTAAQLAPATVPAEGTAAAAGWEVFQQQCIACHNVTYDNAGEVAVLGPTADTFVGPDLTHFASRSVFAGAAFPEQGQAYREALALWLADPPAAKPGSYMPNLALGQTDIDNLIAWLETMK